MEQEKIEEVSHSISQWLMDAVGDLAASAESGWVGEKWQKKIDAAKKNGVYDLNGWLADEYYDDVDTLQDLLGDRIYDESDRSEPESFIQICKCMQENAHAGLKTALQTLIDKRQKHLINLNKEGN